ncbi:hypothetical protein IWQ56_001522 [Coemansia nantahalensis]|uniref:Uncharacterized protein n=1 Tax=Coemansia nantahalensis TaxID=2789366 RepID=A0ACC1JLS6_9FUNG|nr:hypothetical protein IWQ57_005902 [Coemansia nantahalensis]KAJ2772117.1 hypothetical protein IWQ56_001522 [Coemansia nantahalensis]
MGTHRYALLDDGPRPKRLLVQLVIFLLTAAILIAIIVPTTLNYAEKHAAGDKLDASAGYATGVVPFSVGDEPGTFVDHENKAHDTALASFYLHFSLIDPLALTAKARLTIDQSSTYREITDGSYELLFNGDVKKVNSSSFSYEWTHPITVMGDSGKYPFDKYEDEGIIFAFAPGQTLEKGISSELTVTAAHTGFDFKTSAEFKDGAYVVALSANRQSATKGFSLFVVVLSWVLSLCQFFIATQSLIRNRPIIPPLLAVPAAMLFALPSLRNIQPGVPPIGIVLDIAGFYWNMALVALSLIISGLMFIYQFETPKRSEA